MFGKAYFTDGHIESITGYQFNPQNTELYFMTPSKAYGYKKYVETGDFEMQCGRRIFKNPCCAFYKYVLDINKWVVTADIKYIEIYTEVLHDA